MPKKAPGKSQALKTSPSTGSSVLDGIIEEQFTEAIEIACQVVKDHAPVLDQAVVEKIAVNMVVNLWRPMARLVIDGIQRGEEIEA